MAEPSPAYLWYPKDALSSGRIAALSDLEELWYRRALDHAWLAEGLPSDPSEFAGWVGRGCTPESAKKIIDRFFILHKKDPSKVVMPRQEKERANLRKKNKQKSDAGKLGMAKRWKQKSNSDNTVITKDNIPIPIAIAIKEEEKRGNPASPDATLSAIHSEKILSGITKELGLTKLSNIQKRAWLFHTDLAFQNNFSADEFVRCFVALRKKHDYPILPEYVTDRLPDFVRRNKPVEVLPTIDQKKADDAINAAALTMPPQPITIGAMQ